MDKRISLPEAARLVRPDSILGLGGITLYRRPVGFVRELLRQAPDGLTLLVFTGGYESDLLVGAGLARRVHTCYFGLEAFGLAPMYTRLATAGEITVIEESEASLACGFRATMSGVGFMPSLAWFGTDLFRVRPDVRVIDDPYTGQPVAAFPALRCDLAVLHAPEADRSGNVRLGGSLAIDPELAMIADQVVVTAERVVDQLEGKVDIPGVLVTGVVEAPGGAWPTSCYPNYPVDGDELLAYVEACAADQFADYVGTLDHRAPRTIHD
jgi:glutaconate CoA-transferase subunit A